MNGLGLKVLEKACLYRQMLGLGLFEKWMRFVNLKWDMIWFSLGS